jgi:hypothetical protein
VSEDQSGNGNSVHVLVVDEDGEPVTGQDVAAHFSSAQGRASVHHQHTNIEGHVEFVSEHAADPLHVEIFVQGKSLGPYPVENGATHTVKVSRE